jgi:hypothetical protein
VVEAIMEGVCRLARKDSLCTTIHLGLLRAVGWTSKKGLSFQRRRKDSTIARVSLTTRQSAQTGALQWVTHALKQV